MLLKSLPEFLNRSSVNRNISPSIFESSDYPFKIFIEREQFPRRGTIIISDVDKTYLNTDFESIKGLMWIPFEVAVDKVTIGRMNYIYQGLRFGRGDLPQFTPLFFVTASPPLVYKALSSKMLRDGVEYDAIIMKDQPELFKKLKFYQLKTQVTYKLYALFEMMRLLPGKNYSLLLLGDDTESDMKIYTLFKRIVEEKPPVFKVADLLLENGVEIDYLEGLLRLIREFDKNIKIRYIFIYLTKKEFLVSEGGAPVIQYSSTDQLATFLHRKGFINDYYLKKIVLPGSENYDLAVEWLRDYGYI